MKGNITISYSEMVKIADKVQEVRLKEGWTKTADSFCHTLALIAMIHSRNIVESREQMELQFQEASAEHYVQQRERDEVFYNWVDDI